MALSKHMMKRLIEEDGHLELEGNETEHELRQALVNLYSHYPSECRNRYSGIPIMHAIPGVWALAPTSDYRHPRKRVKKIDDIRMEGSTLLC